MSRTLVRLRIRLPRRREIEAVSISLVAHLVLSAAIAAAGLTWGGTSELKPSRGTLTVDLVGRPEAAPPPTASPKSAPARSETPPPPEVARPEPRPEPKEPPPRRVQADAPTRVEEKLEGATAQPEELPVADETPASPAPSVVEGEGLDAPSPDEEGREGTEIEPVGGGAGLGVETLEPFDADYYVNVVVLKLRNAWRDRPVLPQGSEPRRAVVAFRIARDGTVTEAGVAVSSGLRLLDESALRAVEAVGRFPPLPRSYEKDSLGARFVFELLPPE